MSQFRTHLKDDWYGGGIPANVNIGTGAYVDTSYGFALFQSQQNPGLVLGDASGAYDRAAFVVGPNGKVVIGAYTCLNATYLICNERIEIGSNCLLAWSVVITDSWPSAHTTLRDRQAALRRSSADPGRPFPSDGGTSPVILEDNVWVGFGAVILPGVRLGTGCIVGCKSVISSDVEPYTVVAGDPPRLIRRLDPREH